MAWIDDRAWCHPKIINLSDAAFRAWVNGISYSAGMATRGVLTLAQQRLLSGGDEVRDELVEATLWIASEGGCVEIKDWGEHNGKRDERRAADRERKRLARLSAGTSTGQSAGSSAGTARVDSSEGSDRVTTTATDDADEMADLANAGWTGKQIREAHGDIPRALAWLYHAYADATCRSPGALAWSMFKNGGWPEEPREPESTLANGAVGTRSESKSTTYSCEECGSLFDTYLAREEHVDATHFEPAPPPVRSLA